MNIANDVYVMVEIKCYSCEDTFTDRVGISNVVKVLCVPQEEHILGHRYDYYDESDLPAGWKRGSNINVKNRYDALQGDGLYCPGCVKKHEESI